MKIEAGINGFGRFGLHLLKYWIDRSEQSQFDVKYINDDKISIDKAVEIIRNDSAVIFNKYKVKNIEGVIRILNPEGRIFDIEYSNYPKNEIPWLGKPRLVFECSGKNTLRSDCSAYIKNNTKHVIISATSWDADDTLIYGYNHEDYDEQKEVISYGSCTVNAYVPIANCINNLFGVIDSDVNVIHNIQEYRLGENNTLNRKFCTLEKSALSFLEFLNKDNFLVNYTVVPYTGVSMIDFRFKLKKELPVEEIIKALDYQVNDGSLQGLYNIDEVDIGPEIYNCTTFSSVVIKEHVKLINNNLYLFAYFDNENSTNRYYDLVNFISRKIS